MGKEEKKDKKGKEKKGKKGDKKAAKKDDKKKKKKALIGTVARPLVAQDAKNPAPKSVQLSTEAKKVGHWGCVRACTPSPVESRCVTACEAEHYGCLDAVCQAKVLKHYQDTKGIEKKEEKKKDKKAEKGKKGGDKKEKKKGG